MSVEFTDVGQKITWQGVEAVNALYNQPQSYSFKIYPDSLASQDAGPAYWLNNEMSDTGKGFHIYTQAGELNRLYFAIGFDDTAGIWRTDTDTLSINAWQDITITYNGANGISENPIMYIEGISKAVTEIQTPVGNIWNPSGQNLLIGRAAGINTPDGKEDDPRLYNRILTPAEIITLTTPANRNKYVVPNGLVFWAKMDSAKDLASFDGKELTSDNKIIDVIGNIEGTPAGSPIGRGVTDKITSAGVDALSLGEGAFHRLWMDDSGIHGTTTVDTG